MDRRQILKLPPVVALAPMATIPTAKPELTVAELRRGYGGRLRRSRGMGCARSAHRVFAVLAIVCLCAIIALDWAKAYPLEAQRIKDYVIEPEPVPQDTTYYSAYVVRRYQ
jgi:hypothetical protein